MTNWNLLPVQCVFFCVIVDCCHPGLGFKAQCRSILSPVLTDWQRNVRYVFSACPSGWRRSRFTWVTMAQRKLLRKRKRGGRRESGLERLLTLATTLNPSQPHPLALVQLHPPQQQCCLVMDPSADLPVPSIDLDLHWKNCPMKTLCLHACMKMWTLSVSHQDLRQLVVTQRASWSSLMMKGREEYQTTLNMGNSLAQDIKCWQSGIWCVTP